MVCSAWTHGAEYAGEPHLSLSSNALTRVSLGGLFHLPRQTRSVRLLCRALSLRSHLPQAVTRRFGSELLRCLLEGESEE